MRVSPKTTDWMRVASFESALFTKIRNGHAALGGIVDPSGALWARYSGTPSHSILRRFWFLVEVQFSTLLVEGIICGATGAAGATIPAARTKASAGKGRHAERWRSKGAGLRPW